MDSDCDFIPLGVSSVNHFDWPLHVMTSTHHDELCSPLLDYVTCRNIMFVMYFYVIINKRPCSFAILT